MTHDPREALESERAELMALADELNTYAKRYSGDWSKACPTISWDQLKLIVKALRLAAQPLGDVREACKRAVAGELLQDCTGTPDDIAYNNAIYCALAALAALDALVPAGGVGESNDALDAIYWKEKYEQAIRRKADV